MEFTFEKFKRVCSELFPEAGEFACINGAGKIYSAQIMVRGEPCTVHLMLQPHGNKVNIYSVPPIATIFSAEGAEEQLRFFAKEVRKFG